MLLSGELWLQEKVPTSRAPNPDRVSGAGLAVRHAIGLGTARRLADPIMELEIEPRRPGQRSIRDLRRQVGNVFARWRDTSQ